MQLRDTLLAISDDARGWLKAWASDFEETDALGTGSAPINPLAWQLGHIAGAEDDVHRLFSKEPALMPESLVKICGAAAGPPPPGACYPTLAELWKLLDATHARILALVRSATDADFDRASSPPNRYFKTLGQSVYELALHENYHVGQIATLRKALGKSRIG